MTTHGLAEKIAGKQAIIGVIGLGYVGLPLIRAFVKAPGFKTMGFDVDQSKVDKLKAGQSYIKHIDSGAIAKLISEKQFEPTSEMTRLREADCIIICVPTPLNESRDPDLSYIEGTARSIAKTLRRATGRSRKHHTSDDHSGKCSTCIECNRSQSGPGLFSGIQPGTRGSR